MWRNPLFAQCIAGLVVFVILLAGCKKAEVPYLETKRVDETLTDRDVAIVIDILETVSESDRDLLVTAFLPAPAWEKGRTLPVRELIATEQEAAERQQSIEFLAERLKNSPAWTKAIAKGRITPNQFCGLFLSTTAAYLRGRIDSKLALADLAELAELQVRSLELDDRTFSSLTSEEQYQILYSAVWLAIGERAEQLNKVPEENVALIRSIDDQLKPLLPAAFQVDVFEGLYPRPRDYGVPFNEGALSDANLTWSAANAIIGDDLPDDERTASGK